MRKNNEKMVVIYTRYVIRNGKVYYPQNKKYFRFAVPEHKHKEYIERKAKRKKEKE